jgi:hypothetical protein
MGFGRLAKTSTDAMTSVGAMASITALFRPKRKVWAFSRIDSLRGCPGGVMCSRGGGIRATTCCAGSAARERVYQIFTCTDSG